MNLAGRIARGELTALCDTDPRPLQKHPQLPTFASAEALFAADAVDAVLIATRTRPSASPPSRRACMCSSRNPFPSTAPEGAHSVELANAILLSAWTGAGVDLPVDAGLYARRLRERAGRRRLTKKNSAPS